MRTAARSVWEQQRLPLVQRLMLQRKGCAFVHCPANGSTNSATTAQVLELRAVRPGQKRTVRSMRAQVTPASSSATSCSTFWHAGPTVMATAGASGMGCIRQQPARQASERPAASGLAAAGQRRRQQHRAGALQPAGIPVHL